MDEHISTIRGLLEAACAGKESIIRTRKDFGLHFQDAEEWRTKYRAALAWLDTLPQLLAIEDAQRIAALEQDVSEQVVETKHYRDMVIQLEQRIAELQSK